MRKIFTLSLLLLSTFWAFAQPSKNIKDIAIFLQSNVEILDFAGPMEVFIAAGYNVYTVAESTQPMKAMHSLTVVPDYTLENAPTPDIVVFVGGGDIATSKKQNVKKWIKKVVPNTQLQLTVCTGAFFMAEVGFLNGKTATTYHKSIGHLQSQFPQINVRSNVRFVDNGKIITTAGISAGIDGALHVVSKLKGEKFAQQVARTMEYDKWVPKEGLIVQKTSLKDWETQGFGQFIRSSKAKNLYLGEILNLVDELTKKKAYTEAEKGIKYVIGRTQQPTVDVYEYLRENYKLQGKSVPPTSREFMQTIKKEGVAEAKSKYLKIKTTFNNWVFINPDDLVELAYLDYYLKGKPAKAIEIQSFAKNIFPKNAYITYVLGVYHEKKNQIKQAVKLYKEAMKLEPGFAMAQDKLDALKKQGKI